MFIELALVQFLVHTLVQLILVDEVLHLQFQLVVELFKRQLIPNLHLVP